MLAITECGLSNLAEKCLFSAAFFRFSAITIIFLGRRSAFVWNRFDAAAGFGRLPLCLAVQRQGVAAWQGNRPPPKKEHPSKEESSRSAFRGLQLSRE